VRVEKDDETLASRSSIPNFQEKPINDDEPFLTLQKGTTAGRCQRDTGASSPLLEISDGEDAISPCPARDHTPLNVKPASPSGLTAEFGNHESDEDEQHPFLNYGDSGKLLDDAGIQCFRSEWQDFEKKEKFCSDFKGRIDMVLTDPPYNLTGSGPFGAGTTFVDFMYDKEIRDFTQCCRRMLMSEGVFVLFTSW